MTAVQTFIDNLQAVAWFKPDPAYPPPAYMRVEKMPYDRAVQANCDATWANQYGWHPWRWYREYLAMESARSPRFAELQSDAVNLRTPDAFADRIARVMACAIDNPSIDSTWIRRWWRAYELGYFPITEDGDVLLVADVSGSDRALPLTPGSVHRCGQGAVMEQSARAADIACRRAAGEMGGMTG